MADKLSTCRFLYTVPKHTYTSTEGSRCIKDSVRPHRSTFHKKKYLAPCMYEMFDHLTNNIITLSVRFVNMYPVV